MLELRFDVESAYALEEEPPSERNWAKWTEETLNSVAQICSLLERQQIPASFFIVGLLMETLPVKIEEGYRVRAREFEYALDRQMIYAPAYHPWSVCRSIPNCSIWKVLSSWPRRGMFRL